MGIHTMSTQGGGSGSRQESQFQSMTRQGSLYSLTLNEVQNHLGEPLHSMNLDELLKTVFPGEVSQPVGMEPDPADGQYGSGSGLQRQGSITLPRTLSKKTVDEVWRGIQQGKKEGSEDQRPDRKPTLGEVTLEDFLAKAGVVTEGSTEAVPMTGAQDFSQGAPWLQYQHHQNMMGGYVPGHPAAQPMGVAAGPMLDAMYTDGQMSVTSPTVGTLSDSQTSGQKRGASGDMVDKLLERRQKRMIKNRESAARSRARKQAYTNELEIKVSRLEEENEKLKKQKKLDEILFASQPEPKYQLRRTSSAAF